MPGRLRLALLGLAALVAVVALVVAAQIPHDYQTSDLAEIGRADAAIWVELLLAISGGIAGLAAIGWNRARDASVFGASVYLAGAGLALYLMLNGEPTIQGPALVLLGASMAVGAALGLAGLPGWLARSLGFIAGLVIAAGVEALRGPGSLGGGPVTASHEALSLAAIEGLLLLIGTALLLRAHWRTLVRPLGLAAVGLGFTTAVLVLRGPGEWAPVPSASSTTLYGLPLALLASATGLAIFQLQTDRRGGIPELPVSPPLKRRSSAVWPGVPLAASVLLLFGLLIGWHPAVERCAAEPYADSSPLTPSRPVWAVTPDRAAPRGSPDIASFNEPCTYHASNVGQIIYTYYPTCKWAQVDSNYPLVQATGTLRNIEISNEDSPWLHTTHDLGLDLAVDQASSWLVLGGGGQGAMLHTELESGPFPLAYRPVDGDRITVAGRWIYDCGHDAKTELHPAAVVASEHEEWRAGAPGGPGQAHVLRVWMNSAPGMVHVPLAPVNLTAGFPARPTGQAATPDVQVVAGRPDAVQWTVSTVSGAPEASLHIVPPAQDGSAYFELLLGYREASPTPGQPVSYTLTFDNLTVHDDLRGLARNTTGLPVALGFPEIGFAGRGHWTMQVIAGHAWRSILEDAAVQSGHTYSLAAVPPVPLFAPGNEHLDMAITGYAENDPSAGVELASGTVNGPGMRGWDAGRLADLCCGTPLDYAPPHSAWTLSFHVSRSTQ